MPIINSNSLQPGETNRQIYNCLDAAITLEVFEQLCKIHGDPGNNIVYNFERALQAPLLEMMLRGTRVDEFERKRALDEMTSLVDSLKTLLNRFAMAVWNKPLNSGSPKQVKDFLYKAMNLPEQFKWDKGVKKLSSGREALEKLDVYLHAGPVVKLIFRIREVEKEMEVLKRAVDPDGRMRTSFNMTTETGRLSSSKSTTGSGGNMQNLKRDENEDTFGVRKIFIADEGWKFLGIDLEQAESREVGWLHWILFGDSRYLDAVYEGDIHTAVARGVWKNLPWTGDLKKDRKIAERKYYKQHTYRDVSKVCGHLTNYFGQPPTMAKQAKLPIGIAKEFQEKYATAPDAAFPAFPKWWQHVAIELQTKRSITTVFGRKRQFFGRPRDDSTLREAIAFGPQSQTADRMNLGLWRIWKHLGERVKIVLQVHDAVYMLVRENDDMREIVDKVLSLIDIRFYHNGKTLIVPGEAKVGWNLSNYDEKFNPNGLKKWKGEDKRVRISAIDRRI